MRKYILFITVFPDWESASYHTAYTEEFVEPGNSAKLSIRDRYNIIEKSR